MSDLKYETIPDPSGLLRIRALRDIPRYGVKAGDLGGLIEQERNLSQSGDAWIGCYARAVDDAEVAGYAVLAGKAVVGERALVGGNALVRDKALVSGNAKVRGNAWLSGDSLVSGNALVRGNALVSGNAKVRGDGWVDGNALVVGDALVRHASDLLTATIQASMPIQATLCRTAMSHHLIVDRWEGKVADFRAMIESDTWVEATPEQIKLRRPEMLAFTAMCEARIATWEAEK
ncbi:hypothetical protein ODZ83_05505 [Acaricomes phytoseiuli]|uniref:hypothetical protein n=1 Tax=Acaricomes phytoseiuli TaxID=291968 RepID=UPI0022216541|nr:hypothetical protein [Acaricomes phytoseiuli]MCW1249647.1 hypothetical protein [Acaricomes phytoseiuli]